MLVLEPLTVAKLLKAVAEKSSRNCCCWANRPLMTMPIKRHKRWPLC